jgi:hypothetical protein
MSKNLSGVPLMSQDFVKFSYIAQITFAFINNTGEYLVGNEYVNILSLIKCSMVT